MGWDGKNTRWTVEDIKREWEGYNNNNRFTVMYSSTVNGNNYLAVRNNETKTVFAVVNKLEMSGGEYFKKTMDETMNPFYYDAPEKLLNMLSETTNQNAIDWRNECRNVTKKKKELKENIKFGNTFWVGNNKYTITNTNYNSSSLLVSDGFKSYKYPKSRYYKEASIERG